MSVDVKRYRPVEQPVSKRYWLVNHAPKSRKATRISQLEIRDNGEPRIQVLCNLADYRTKHNIITAEIQVLSLQIQHTIEEVKIANPKTDHHEYFCYRESYYEAKLAV